jgi:hypothetical protein
MRAARQLGCLLAVLAAVLLVAAPAAFAEPFGLSGFDVSFTGPEGEEVTQAGSHPFQMTTSFRVNTKEIGGKLFVSEPLKDLEVAQVPGLVGNPTAVPPCSAADFLTSRENPEPAVVPSCPDTSAVGLVGVESIVEGSAGSEKVWSAVYSLEPPPGVPAEFGFWTANVPVTLEAGVKESPPYDLVAHVRNVSQLIEVTGTEFILWGDPADPAHNALRGFCAGGKGLAPISFGNCPAEIANRPFLTLPRACNGPLATSYEADSWEHPGVFSATGSALTHDSSEPPQPQGMTGCSKLDFGPEVSIRPGTGQAESPAGLDLEITTKDEGLANPEGVAEADIEATEFAFPPGMTLNPSAAEGLGVCTEAQFKAEDLAAHGCPEASKLGSLEVETPVLENHTLNGAVYLAKEHENPFGSLFAAYLVIRDPGLGVFVKLPAEIETDPTTGRVIAAVEELPPFPLSRVRVHLRAGPRAPLVTPPSCGIYSTEAALTPSSGAAERVSFPSFQVTSGPGGGPCPSGAPPFDPGFEAGTANNAASQYSPFGMRITRSDGQQDITRFSATLPPGVVGKLAGVARCPDAAVEAARAPGRTAAQEIASPSCPASSQIGTVLAGAGVGTALTYVPGSLYLAGPFRGDPLSVVAIVPAKAGPFDVGVVVTREALNVNPTTAQVEVDGSRSDPIPHILEGIPLKLRELRVNVDRSDFTLNATSCAPEQGLASIFGSGPNPFISSDDVPVARSARYQAASCASLGFKPKLTLTFKGGTKRAQFPAVHSTVKYPYPSGPGYANIGKAVVTLPPSEFVANAHINNPCTRVQFNEGKCPPGSLLGSAKAVSPLLGKPLQGPVYFRSNGGARKLPDVVADLHSEDLQFVLVGFIKTVVNHKTHVGRLQTTFASVPDAPVSSFELNLLGGKHGLLENNTNLCAKKRFARVELTGHNGAPYNSDRLVTVAGCKKHRAKSGKSHG